ncbi:MAG: SDR family oxidoreductase [Dehalococcoidia bacterium]
MKLEGQVALITGAGRNIGRAIALAMAEEGAHVVVNGLNDLASIQEVARIIEEKGGRALPVIADVGDPDQVHQMVEQATRELGTIDILVSNAAIRPHGPLTEISLEDWRKVMAVDLDATFFLSKEVVPGMLEKGKGSIIAISGLAAFGLRTGTVAVATAKAGIIGMMRAVAMDYADKGIRANTIVPGNMATERYDQQAYVAGREPVHVGGSGTGGSEGVPMGRRGYPEELAAACVYFASDDSGYTTGQTLHVGGGLYME